MIKNKKLIIVGVIILILVCVSVVLLFGKTSEDKTDNTFEIVTTFYPVELIVDNITKNTTDVLVVNITKNVGGCVHDYELTPNQLKKQMFL